jgi:hypothetical protein
LTGASDLPLISFCIKPADVSSEYSGVYVLVWTISRNCSGFMRKLDYYLENLHFTVDDVYMRLYFSNWIMIRN